MDATLLWNGRLDWTRLLVAGRTLLVHGDVTRRGRYTNLARAFDLDTLQPLGEAFATGETVCLAGLPERWPDPVVIDALPGSLVLRDPATGSALGEVPFVQPPRESLTGLAAGAVGDRSLAFVFDEDPWHEFEWWAVDLDTGERVPGLGDDCRAFSLVRERLILVGDHLIVPMQDIRFDDLVMDETEDPRQRVYGLSDGRRIAEVDCEGGEEAVAAVVGGRSLMAAKNKVYALPGLTLVADVGYAPGRVVRALAEWRGLPVLVLTEREIGYFPGGDHPFRLFFRFLDHPDRPSVEIPWTGAKGLHDVAAAGDGTVVVATSEGVYALRARL
ncbi:hypothetical protein [Nocardiopsis synnemataformans]|uniref:hypothetical protein n=1 Tax=Nocardiopsis synnemataformans TaxID=61305 RepID=UPI003EBA4F35